MKYITGTRFNRLLRFAEDPRNEADKNYAEGWERIWGGRLESTEVKPTVIPIPEAVRFACGAQTKTPYADGWDWRKSDQILVWQCLKCCTANRA